MENLIKELILEALPGANVTISDPMSDGRHMEAVVISDHFIGLSRVAQHKLVMEPLRAHFDTDALHALKLKTLTPDKESGTMDSLSEILDVIGRDIKENRVILFMKGDKEMPQCGFSAQVVHILNLCGVDYVTRNVLMSDALRQGIKEFSDWPTIPQLYIDGEFIGGCDIVTEMYEEGELQEVLAQG